MSSEPTREIATSRPASDAASRSPASSLAPVVLEPSRTRSGVSRSRVATPAAIDSGCPLSVPAWYTGPSGAMWAIRSARPP